jgi:hypothetical protein
MNRIPHRPPREPHIDIYQRGSTGNAMPDVTQRKAGQHAGIEKAGLKPWAKPIILADERRETR